MVSKSDIGKSGKPGRKRKRKPLVVHGNRVEVEVAAIAQEILDSRSVDIPTRSERLKNCTTVNGVKQMRGADYIPSTVSRRGGSGPRYTDKMMPAMCDLIRRLALLGATNKAIARVIHLHPDAFDDWVDKRDDLRAALNEGRAYADAAVAESMYHRAVGYEYEEREFQRQPVYGVDDDGKQIVTGYEMVNVKSVRKHEPANIGAMCFWLKNRTRLAFDIMRWRDKIDVDFGNVDMSTRITNINVDMSAEDAANAYRHMLDSGTYNGGGGDVQRDSVDDVQRDRDVDVE